MNEKNLLIESFLKKSLQVIFISVACLVISNIAFSQENMTEQGETTPTSENNVEQENKKTSEKTKLTPNEEKLNTIRELLISEALKSKAKVKASSWIDTQGSLHENLYVLSEGYITEDESLKNNIREKGFNINKLKSHKKPKYCRFSDPAYARVAEVSVNVGRSSLELPYNDLETIRKKVENLFKTGVSTHQRWVFVQKNQSTKHPMNVSYLSRQ